MVNSQGIEVMAAGPETREPLSRMLELYQHDLSDIWDQDLDAKGEYGYDLSRYWLDPGCFPYVFLAAGHFAGFALVDQAVKLPGGEFWMDQFFVMKKYRRRGLGRQAAHDVFARHRGAWQVGQMTANKPAQEFWRATITAFTVGGFVEQRLTEGWWQGSIQTFRS